MVFVGNRNWIGQKRSDDMVNIGTELLWDTVYRVFVLAFWLARTLSGEGLAEARNLLLMT